ncbi:MAG: YceI family protein, partial [Bacteroidota bacterium]
MSKQTWEIDLEHANVKFTIPHMVIGKVVGLIKSFGGTITSQGVDFNDAQVEALLDPSSLDTNNAKRD